MVNRHRRNHLSASLAIMSFPSTYHHANNCHRVYHPDEATVLLYQCISVAIRQDRFLSQASSVISKITTHKIITFHTIQKFECVNRNER